MNRNPREREEIEPDSDDELEAEAQAVDDGLQVTEPERQEDEASVVARESLSRAPEPVPSNPEASPKVVAEADEGAGADVDEGRAEDASEARRLERKLTELRRLRKRHEALIRDLMHDVRDLRLELKTEKLPPKEQAARMAKFVADWKASDGGKDLTKILKPIERAAAKTGREKLTDIVTLGVRLRVWSDADFLYRYGERFGKEIAAWFDEREGELEEALTAARGDEELDQAA